jgi:hypothetical protein
LRLKYGVGGLQGGVSLLPSSLFSLSGKGKLRCSVGLCLYEGIHGKQRRPTGDDHQPSRSHATRH